MTKDEKKFNLKEHLPEYTTVSVRLTMDERKMLEEMCRKSVRSTSDMIRYALAEQAIRWSMLWPESE